MEAGRRKLLLERKCRACPHTIRDGLTRHHLVRKGSPWFGPDEDWNLIPLCVDCHMAFHGSPRWRETGRSIRRTLNAEELAGILAWAGPAYLDRYYPADEEAEAGGL